ncbi:MAG: type II and III secretion system protein, partial [Lentisphaeria bacterium]|nr:type II and III secretion system protein [Lentisphaeria bacterium]
AAQWEQVIPLLRMDSSSEVQGEQGGVEKVGAEAKIRDKLRNIIVDVVNFDEVAVPTAIHYLWQKSKAADPEKIGVNFILRGKINQIYHDGGDSNAAKTNANAGAAGDDKSGQSSEIRPVILSLTNEPLETVLNYICKFANLKYRVDENAVVIASKDVPLESVQTKVYPVETTAFNLQEGRTAQDVLTDAGMVFEAGASAVFKDYIGRLFITNTPEQLQFFEQKILSELTKESPQVLIQTKFVEIKLNDLEELGFKYSLSRANNNIRYISATDSRLVELAPNESFTSSSIDNIYQKVTGTNASESSKQWLSWVGTNSDGKIRAEDGSKKLAYKYTNTTGGPVYYSKAPLQPSSTTFSVGGTDLVRSFSAVGTLETGTTDGRVLDFSKYNKNGYSFNAQIYALDQADSADVLSCPRVTTMNETPASIKLTTEKYFPEEWEEAEYDMMGNNVPVFIGSTPELDEATELGIMLDVTPVVQGNSTIHLRMQPLIRTFTGWDDYSYTVPIQIGDLPVQNVPNTMRMPIFQQRTVDTQVSCEDNGTIVLGGMIQDTLTTLDDRYPILGDLPLIGRLFQSKGRRSTKYNLLIFLSCRLVLPNGAPL